MLAKASEISHYSYLTAAYALGCGYLFFGEILSFKSFIGFALLLTGILLNTKFSKKS
jgi:drug/metabolite transporter (DMT)-like permease